jgi:hypothetical protein
VAKNPSTALGHEHEGGVKWIEHLVAQGGDATKIRVSPACARRFNTIDQPKDD